MKNIFKKIINKKSLRLKEIEMKQNKLLAWVFAVCAVIAFLFGLKKTFPDISEGGFWLFVLSFVFIILIIIFSAPDDERVTKEIENDHYKFPL